VLPTPQQAKADGIDIIRTPFQHTWLSDRGPASAKERIQATVDNFLGKGNASELAPADTDSLIVNNAGAPLIGMTAMVGDSDCQPKSTRSKKLEAEGADWDENNHGE
jgi:hypothetical protein